MWSDLRLQNEDSSSRSEGGNGPSMNSYSSNRAACSKYAQGEWKWRQEETTRREN
jgi:hypothetical protein